MGEFHAQAFANTAWAFALAGRLDTPFFSTLASATARRIGESSAQEIAITAWASAIAGHSDDLMFATLAEAAERCVGEFTG